MEYRTLYEAQYGCSLSTEIIVFFVITILLILITVFCWKNFETILKCIHIFLIALFAFVSYTSINSYLDIKINLHDKYFNDKYETVEGVIENYYASPVNSNGPDRFSVSDVDFSIININYTGFGYTSMRIDGGILEDNMKVRIKYVFYKFENVIMKLEFVPNE